ncbi:hypothetical protein ACSIGC_11230 [Tenacibaculum sp. ZS6-P6]|uniref:hypothetical protein n=1 Tax=Tenacibaculum sp. ZS6-P6 TaxID=3447503 RepID=UPI003F96F762
MEFTFLKKLNEVKDSLENSPVILRNPEGNSVEEIYEYQKVFNQGLPLPKSLIEYLFISGKFCPLGFDVVEGNYLGLRKYYDKKLEERGVKIERPFMIFDNFEGESFMFVYLDEGDDPQPWNCSVNEDYDSEDNEIIWKVPHPTFSDLVNALVDRAIKGLQPW